MSEVSFQKEISKINNEVTHKQIDLSIKSIHYIDGIPLYFLKMDM